jgi:hypothetical protein
LSHPGAGTGIRNLSSSRTWRYKYQGLFFLPILAAVTLALYLAGNGGAMRFVVLVSVCVLPFYLWDTIRLKLVRMDDRSLYVSDFHEQEIVVPLATVTRVTDSWFVWANPQTVTIHFSDVTPFGRSVTFVPHRSRWPSAFDRSGRPSLLAEIRDAVLRARPA